ncbi:MAG TPA: hypothetical protein PKM73_20970 [Verrucomicrobiota bacterium]|nr:hypothetical protein [Verrucomicrobiota bacterium]HNU50871.1 hypothetical protein [Verrucomicrobiota bacterium]
MKTSHLNTLLASLVAAWALGVAVGGGDPGVPGDPERRENVQSQSARQAGTSSGEVKATRYPVRGKLKAVDLKARTFTLAGAEKDRTFQTRPQTAFTRQGKAAKLEDAVVGEDVGGLVEKQPDGTAIALTVRLGAKPELVTDKPATRKAASKKAKSDEMSP